MIDKNQNTPIHTLAMHYPKHIAEMIKSELVLISNLAKMKNNEGKPPLDFISEIVWRLTVKLNKRKNKVAGAKIYF